MDDYTQAYAVLTRQLDYSLKMGHRWNHLLHDEQRALTTGSAFIMAATLHRTDDVAKYLPFCLAADDSFVGYGDATGGLLTEQAAKGLGVMLTHHVLLSVAADLLHPSRYPIAVHASLCWPISLELYASALDVGWDPERLPPAQRVHLEVALAAYEGWLKTTPAQFRGQW